MGPTLKEWLKEKPFTLSLSSGFFSFFAHCGMLSVLEENDLLPVKITGSSAGALIGTLWASGLDCDTMRESLFRLRKEDFWDPSLGLGLLKGEKFRKIIDQMIPVGTFDQCRVPLYLSAYEGFTKKTRVFSQGDLTEALYASCAVPFLFQPIRIDNRLYWDGGVDDRPGLKSVIKNERVFYHHIVSKSPWRKKNSLALIIPERDNLASLAIKGVPRVGPNDMRIGYNAFEKTRHSTIKALETQLLKGGIVLD